ncbi:hypothetical protein OG422_29730 [Streptomyces sp. NBC_01525]|uniref:hypothetical protein n=1 Tax=Streptomyces sp. NBC_01525 TaxID=2903893 RepID=UPI0038698D15
MGTPPSATPVHSTTSPRIQKEIEYEAEDHSGVSLSAEARAILDGYVPQTGEPACRHPRLAPGTPRHRLGTPDRPPDPTGLDTFSARLTWMAGSAGVA